jgi:hypothetical protein
VDPLLIVSMRQLVATHGKEAVLAAAQAVGKRELNPDATREEKARLAAVIDRLHYDRETFNPFQFCQRAMGARIPMAVCVEVLERVAEVHPEAPWALLHKIMRDDYPHYGWGRG